MNDEARMSNDETMTKSENRNISADESFWDHDAESVVCEEPAKLLVYDLKERTARFGEAVIDFAKTDSARRGHESFDQPTRWCRERLSAPIMWKPTMRFRKRISKKHWHVPKRSARNEAFSPDDRSCSAGSETVRSDALA